MSDTFTAKTGRTVAIKSRSMTGTILEISGLDTRTTVDLGDVATLREFFQHERDKELGRWRWPDNPDYVVYPDGTSRTVVKESDGRTMIVSIHDRKVMTTYLDSYVGAAKAYDAAHPEPKPWHDAKAEEIWVLRERNCETWLPFRWDAAEQWWFASSSNMAMHRRSEGTIVEGRRIWPEVPSE